MKSLKSSGGLLQAAVVGIALTVVGCGSEYAVVPVSGRVTLDGQPLDGAAVTFQPTGGGNPGPGSYGRTDADGRYSLKMVTDDTPGALPGKHMVTISTSGDSTETDDSGRLLSERVPSPYNDLGVETDVPAGGTDAANFDLQTSAS